MPIPAGFEENYIEMGEDGNETIWITTDLLVKHNTW